MKTHKTNTANTVDDLLDDPFSDLVQVILLGEHRKGYHSV